MHARTNSNPAGWQVILIAGKCGTKHTPPITKALPYICSAIYSSIKTYLGDLN